VAADDERAAIARARAREQTLESLTLDTPADEHAAASVRRPAAREKSRAAM
jgi:hypothetical protein